MVSIPWKYTNVTRWFIHVIEFKIIDVSKDTVAVLLTVGKIILTCSCHSMSQNLWSKRKQHINLNLYMNKNLHLLLISKIKQSSGRLKKYESKMILHVNKEYGEIDKRMKKGLKYK